ncbi:hypothetical protein N9R79_12420, partial [Vibrio sp.]|nr:hypothetical protein [Vibrio sp.]
MDFLLYNFWTKLLSVLLLSFSIVGLVWLPLRGVALTSTSWKVISLVCVVISLAVGELLFNDKWINFIFESVQWGIFAIALLSWD